MDIQAFSCSVPFHPVSNVDIAIFVTPCAFTMPLVVFVFTCIAFSIWLFIRTVSIKLVVFEVSFVNFTIIPNLSTFTSHETIFKPAFFKYVIINPDSSPMCLSISDLSGINVITIIIMFPLKRANLDRTDFEGSVSVLELTILPDPLLQIITSNLNLEVFQVKEVLDSESNIFSIVLLFFFGRTLNILNFLESQLYLLIAISNIIL